MKTILSFIQGPGMEFADQNLESPSSHKSKDEKKANMTKAMIKGQIRSAPCGALWPSFYRGNSKKPKKKGILHKKWAKER